MSNFSTKSSNYFYSSGVAGTGDFAHGKNIRSKNSVTNPNRVSFGMDIESKGEINEKVYSRAVASKLPDTKSILAANSFKTRIFTDDDKEKYNVVSSMLSPQGKVLLKNLLSSGKLMNSEADNKSSVLDSLYKIATKPRIKGLDSSVIMHEVVTAISDPYTITQKFGDIPDNVAEEAAKNPKTEIGSKYSIRRVMSTSCAAASLEFALAHRQPAEFARIVEGLSSDRYSFWKNIKIYDLKDSPEERQKKLQHRTKLFDMFNLGYKLNNDGTATVIVAPDRNAIIRARVQTTHRDKGERSVTDVLVQSAIMQLASQQTYNSLNGIRTGELNNDNEGLSEYEKTFAEEIVTGEEKYSVIYQKLDPNLKLLGRTHSKDVMFSHIKESLKAGKDVVVGLTWFNKDGYCINGHEVTITGIAKDDKQRLCFVYNDTDDNSDNPVLMPVNEMLNKIHHAGIPQELIKQVSDGTNISAA